MRAPVVILIAALLAAGCGESTQPSAAAPAANPFQEVIDLGITRYFGTASPVSSQEPQPGVITYTFDPASGPVCLKGDPFSMSIRDQHSDDLFIFLQGGGACWSDFCLAVTSAPPGIPTMDILDPKKRSNPMRGLSTVYLPYCDGSMFAGDGEHDDDGDGNPDRIQHGLQNLSASLDIAKDTFPNPKRIIFAGSSGGSYGTIIGVPLVRAKWPGVDLLVFEDSGLGLGKPEDPSFIHQLASDAELGFGRLIPPSCTDCLGNGHVTRLIDWQLAHDPQLSIAVFAAYEDLVLSDIFLGVSGAAYHQAVVEETGRLHQRYPDRYRRFLIDGAQHTTLLGNATALVGTDLGAVIIPPDAIAKLATLKIGGIDKTVIGEESIAEWFDAFLTHRQDWADLTE
jgi:hypothetical protein